MKTVQNVREKNDVWTDGHLKHSMKAILTAEVLQYIGVSVLANLSVC